MPSTKKIATEYQMIQWTEIMRQRTESGQSIRAYCKTAGPAPEPIPLLAAEVAGSGGNRNGITESRNAPITAVRVGADNRRRIGENRKQRGDDRNWEMPSESERYEKERSRE